MNKKKVSSKEEGHLALSRGDFKKALEQLQKHCARARSDLRSRLKVAELLERLGRKKEAVWEYQEVAEAYARDGFLLQAISVNKMALRIDPSAKGINARLAQLYTEKNRGLTPPRSLPSIPLFSDLNEQELHSVLNHIQSKIYPRDTWICREGDPGDSLMIICRGEVGIYKQDPEGQEIGIRNLGEGECFGEFGLFIDQKRHAHVKALTDSDILEISRDELKGIIKIYPHVKEVLQGILKKRVLDLLLALSPLFSSFTLSEREEVLKRFRPLSFPEETLLFRGGDASDCLYMIQNGEVEIFTQDRRGKKIVLGRLGSGHLFGEIGVLLNTPRMAFARTTQPSNLLELSKEDFDGLLHRFPKLRSVAKEFSSKRLIQMREILAQEKVEKAKEAMV